MNRRVVFDTSTLISAALRIGSIPHQALVQALAAYDLCASPATLQELERVFARAKFDHYLGRSLRNEFIESIQSAVQLFPVTGADLKSLDPSCRDSKDDPFLALAMVAQAGMIVSGDDDLLVLHPWNGVEILSPAEFLQRRAAPRKA